MFEVIETDQHGRWLAPAGEIFESRDDAEAWRRMLLREYEQESVLVHRPELAKLH